MPNLLDFSDRVAIVTGASRGIGRCVAEQLAAHGANIILNANNNGEQLDVVAHEISERFGVKTATFAGDVGDPDTADTLVKIAFKQHKRLDVYVNNAGVLLDGLIGMVPKSDVQSTLDINLAGVIYGIQSSARLMQRSGGGSIINLTSIIGRFGNVGQVVYGASKAGVIGATLSAAKELAPKNIRVNAIAPGFINTDMVRQIPVEKFDERMQSIGMGRIGEPLDIANAVLFLASDLSSYVTGQVIGVDGSMVI